MSRQTTLPAAASKGTPCSIPIDPARMSDVAAEPASHKRHIHAQITVIAPGADTSRGLFVKKVVNFARSLRADAGDLGEIAGRGAFDGLERAEVLQQRALAGRANAGNFLQP